MSQSCNSLRLILLVGQLFSAMSFKGLGPGPWAPSIFRLHEVQRVAPKVAPGDEPAGTRRARGGLHAVLRSRPGIGVRPFWSFFTDQSRTDARPWPYLPAGEAWEHGIAVCQCLGKHVLVFAFCGHRQETFDSGSGQVLTLKVFAITCWGRL